jgi:hypothetical protein
MSYCHDLKEAVKFTTEMGLSFVGIEFAPLPPLAIELLTNNVITELYNHRNLSVSDLALQCFRNSILVHDFLKCKLNIPSVITTGSLLRLRKNHYFECRETIKNRLQNTSVEYPKPQFHTWLTIGNHTNGYIFDVTLYPTEWFLDRLDGLKRCNDSAYKRIFVNSIAENEINDLCYKPIFLGGDYFNKIRFQETAKTF